MDIRHKNKAITGVAIWLAANALFYACLIFGNPLHQLHNPDSRTTFGLLFLFSIVVQYVTFFWGGNHLAKAKGYPNTMLFLGVLLFFQTLILAVLIFGLPDKHANPTSVPSKRRQGSRHESPTARYVRFRRNAFIANLLGVFGILLAVVVCFLPAHIFPTQDDDRVAALLIFVPSYFAVLSGCWWWVKAKNWTDAVVFIGVMPLTPLAIPYVRIIFVRLIFRDAPLLLPALMVLMPILLIAVVATLPDQSGLDRRRR